MQCKDGYIYLCCIEEHQWRGFVELMGSPEWADEEIFSDRLKRALNWDALQVFLEEWVGQQTVLDLYRKAQAKRVPFAPVSTMGDLLSSEHLRRADFSSTSRSRSPAPTSIPALRSSIIARRGRFGCRRRRSGSITRRFSADASG